MNDSPPRSLRGLPIAEALALLGRLIDDAAQKDDREANELALRLGQDLLDTSPASADAATLHYFLANARTDRERLLRTQAAQHWAWLDVDSESALRHLRSAMREKSFGLLARQRRAEILTNLGNLLNNVGRPIEAVARFDDALAVVPEFGIAFANRAVAFRAYAQHYHDEGQSLVLARRAWQDMSSALRMPLEAGVAVNLRNQQQKLEQEMPSVRGPEPAFDDGSADWTPSEQRYRRWALRERLFLNPMNDVSSAAIAGRDTLNCPTLTTRSPTVPMPIEFVNEIKQQYCSARFILYEGLRSRSPHYSDRETHIVENVESMTATLHELRVERVKAAYRSAYSIFDKVAFLLNDYLVLDSKKYDVSFRKLWYVGGKAKNGLRPELRDKTNWGLRGLFWLSRDLHEDATGLPPALDPEARKLADLRHCFEHKHSKVVEVGLPERASELGAHVIEFPSLVASTLTLFRLARAAVIYLVIGIGVEERSNDRRKGGLTVVVNLPKRQDPPARKRAPRRPPEGR
ncbi:MAG: hypothetical protein IPK60_09355 [Sandaracinaceae bacterium]|nr:hypothetical protein [Sandaracinaceae bacterium]